MLLTPDEWSKKYPQHDLSQYFWGYHFDKPYPGKSLFIWFIPHYRTSFATGWIIRCQGFYGGPKSVHRKFKREMFVNNILILFKESSCFL